jgi:hypothetical protein
VSSLPPGRQKSPRWFKTASRDDVYWIFDDLGLICLVFCIDFDSVLDVFFEFRAALLNFKTS